MLEKALELFAKGYKIYEGSYYGESLCEDIEDVEYIFEELEEDEYLYIESFDVDDELKEVHIFIGDDE